MRLIHIHKNKEQKKMFARKLRKNQTACERIIWECLRKKRLGFRFLRQFIVSGYITDFYCAEKGLAIEIDGGIHLSQKDYDQHRDAAISSLGINILRFTNEQVLHDLGTVISEITKELTI